MMPTPDKCAECLSRIARLETDMEHMKADMTRLIHQVEVNTNRITDLRVQIAYWAGGAAAVGGIVGGVVTSLVTRVIGG